MSSTGSSPLPSALSLLPLPSQSALRAAFIGQPISALRTPAIIVDRMTFIANSERVTKEAERRGMKFRAHVKTHKTIDGVRIQAQAGSGVTAFIASTIPEVHYLAHSGMVEEGLIKDILYSLPISADKLDDLSALQNHCGDKAVIRVMVDHPEQVRLLDADAEKSGNGRSWSCFIKVDGGGRRAGVPADSEQMKTLIQAALVAKHVSIFGFYSHFGQSYASKTLSTAADFYHAEIACVNTAAKVARSLGAKGDWILSVGATPTAHAATTVNEASLDLEGELELHAGCYCLNDAQQLATSLIPPSACALTVLARVVSLYPSRGTNGSPEAMTDCGALAVSKDTGPWAGYGRVVWPEHLTGFDLGRVSQEHGTLVRREGEGSGAGGSEAKVGDLVRILPQHACLVCAGHPWLYIVEDGGETVVDVWVTWKGW